MMKPSMADSVCGSPTVWGDHFGLHMSSAAGTVLEHQVCGTWQYVSVMIMEDQIDM